MPTIERLMRREKRLVECFEESLIPITMWLNERRIARDERSEDGPIFEHCKEYLQSQALPTLVDLRKIDHRHWRDAYLEKTKAFRLQADQPRTARETDDLRSALRHIRFMSSGLPPRDSGEAALPRFSKELKELAQNSIPF